MAPTSASDLSSEGPVLSLLNKRLRALRKKLNRIHQLEDSRRTPLSLNNDQLDLLRSKPSLLARIDELEKLRHPLSLALDRELQLASDKFRRRRESLGKQKESGGWVTEAQEDTVAVADLLALLYFGRIFDVGTLTRGQDNYLARMHDRNCCLTYDFVTDDDDVGSPLNDWDLDVIAMMSNLLISRPDDSRLPHSFALQQCVEHAKLWLKNSELPIHPGLGVTYAGLRLKLNRILESEFVNVSPKIRLPLEAAAAVSSHNYFQIPLHGSFSSQVILTDQGAEYDQEERVSSNSDANEMYRNETGCAEGHHQEGSDVDKYSRAPGTVRAGNT